MHQDDASCGTAHGPFNFGASAAVLLGAFHFILTRQSGALAGLTGDVLLFPLDTIKTRLQSLKGFSGSGGFANVYAGVSVVVAGSIPSALVFFTCYNYCQSLLAPTTSKPTRTLLSAVAAETVSDGCLLTYLPLKLSCSLVRVPVEVLKQRMQVGMASPLGSVQVSSLAAMARSAYSGCSAVLTRDIPFVMVQFPVYEHLKVSLRAAPL